MERLAGRVMLAHGWRRALLAMAAGAVGALALPPLGFFASLFVSFTLLVWLLDGAAGRPGSGSAGRFFSSFLTGWLFGFGYFVAGLWWIGSALLVDADQFAWALPLAVIGLPLFLGLFYGFAAALARLAWSDGLGRIAALSASFGLMEYLRSFLFTGFPWNAIGYGAMPVPMMMQSAHIIGLYGVTLLSVFVFASPALLGTRRGAIPGLGLAFLLFAAHLGYGAFILSRPLPEGQTTLDVRIVQPNIDQSRKIDDKERAAIFEEHLALSAKPPQAGGHKPKLIIWPETSIPFILTRNRDALARIGEVLDDDQVLIAGAVREEQGGSGEPRYYNSALMIDGKGEIIGAADKVHLVPFGEYVPFESLLTSFGIRNVVEMPGGFSSAPARSRLTLPSGPILYPMICYEVIFPNEADALDEGIFTLLNITNDAWFGVTSGPYQHFHQAQVRAVETGFPLIRAANSGISAFVDAKGQILSGLDLNVKATIDATISGAKTVPTKNSDRLRNFWLLFITMILLSGLARFGFILRKN